MGVVPASVVWLLVVAGGVVLLGATAKGEDRPSLGGEDLFRSLVGHAVQHQLGRQLLTGTDDDKHGNGDNSGDKKGYENSPPPSEEEAYSGIQCPYAVTVAFQVLDLQPLSADNGGGYVGTDGGSGLLTGLDLTQVYEIKMVFEIEQLKVSTVVQLPPYPPPLTPSYYPPTPYVSQAPPPSTTPYAPYPSAPPPTTATPYASGPPSPPYASSPPSPTQKPYASAPPSPTGILYASSPASPTSYASGPPTPPYASAPPSPSAPPSATGTPYANFPPSPTPYASAPLSPSQSGTPYAGAQPYGGAPPAGYPSGPGGGSPTPLVGYGS